MCYKPLSAYLTVWLFSHNHVFFFDLRAFSFAYNKILLYCLFRVTAMASFSLYFLDLLQWILDKNHLVEVHERCERKIVHSNFEDY